MGKSCAASRLTFLAFLDLRMNDAELARNYILNRLADEDRDECERRFLFDPEFETTMLEQECALLDDYVNSRLNGEDAQAVLRRVAQEPGRLYRLRIAEGLKHAAEAAETNPPEPAAAPRDRGNFATRRFAWFGGLAAAAAVAIAAIVGVNLHRGSGAAKPNPSIAAAPAAPNPAPRNQEAQPAKPAPAQQPQASPASMATFVLLASEERGESDGTTVKLKPNVAVLRLQLTTQEGLTAGRYWATVSNAGGAAVFKVAHMPTRTEAGRRYIDLRIPAANLGAGDYTIALAQDTAAAPALSFHFKLTSGSAIK